MRKSLALLALLLALLSLAATPTLAQSWQSRVATDLPLLGHRNWILIVDSAYPEQVGPGIETFETNADQLAVVREVLGQIQNSIHVSPSVFLDAELSYVPDQEAPGVSDYRAKLTSLLGDYQVHSRLHQTLIDEVAKDGAQYHVLILKTRLTIPYTSVFIHLDCKYWSASNERGLRESMGAHALPTHPRQ